MANYYYDEEEDGFIDNHYMNQSVLDDSIHQELSKPPGQSQPRLLLMGLRRSGKSSIQSVVFHKMAPNETLFLESTSKVIKDNIMSFIDFQVWDFPGQIDFFDPTFDLDLIFGQVGALVYVIDAQDDYVETLGKLHDTIVRAHKVNPDIQFEIFIHKVDGLSDDYKIDTQREIRQRVTDELADEGIENVAINFHLTSIYDHSIFEAFSKVIQKMIRQLAHLENLLNALCSNSGIEKAYLFDIASKVYLATDSSPVDTQSYEICSDMIDVVVDMSYIYGQNPSSNKQLSHREGTYSSIKLNSGLVLYFRQINKFLALVCLLRNETFEKHGLIDYNFQCFNTAILQVLELCKKSFDDKAGENANQVALNGSHPSQDNIQSPVL
ncbi:hypothetical protein CONCODRAFT_12787 [Conidiobolus coronatus NRRL 28638]|uniref:GTP-binding protein n=1 Tax=Conidiobolus coronatus (strain ATCC 28846 / CBS 209.66 / NRRL 28638) TaxID=796925 RepID=A0A137NS47_CONC2|nr:hypothetical protein CONCODRAFT_12787 [Conidiobolus coronatus NRRL 28638]|eukprot:KXN65581.1 hypothetical protein CONCODRAFT_12787 [Conidiobolus coronatus NRRL 28638]